MINHQAQERIVASRFGSHFFKPLYDSYNFVQIPQIVRSLFGLAEKPFSAEELPPLAEEYQHIVVLFTDSFGWRFFERFSEHPFVKRIIDQGAVSMLTSQFPSTTAAHVTTIHTGLPLVQSGVYEWFYYEPQLDRIFAPLLFSYAGDAERETLREAGIAPEKFFPNQTIYQELTEARGIDSFVFQSVSYAQSSYSRVITKGAQLRPFYTLAEAIVELTNQLRTNQNRTYSLLYFDTIDTICHIYGPDSPFVEAEILNYLNSLEALLHPRLQRTSGPTLLMLISDHGHASVNPNTTVYLNREVPQIKAMLRTNRRGRPLVPAGSARDFFLYVQDAYLDAAHELLNHTLGGKAEVHRTADLLSGGFFGNVHPSRVLLDRMADLVILPYNGQSVWWYEADRFRMRHRGSHGGLTAEELLTPLMLLPYGG